MTWHYKYGYSKNPFEKDTLKTNDSLLNLDKELTKLVHFTNSGSIILLLGPETSGKTRLIKEIITKNSGKNKIVLLKNGKEFDLNQTLIKSQPKIKQLLKIKPKKMILILEDFEQIDEKTQKSIQYNFDQNYLQTVIITSKQKPKLIASMQDRIGTRIIQLKKLSKQKQLEIVKNRINNEKFFKTTLLKKIQKKSKTFNEFLEKTEKAAILAAQRSNKTITEKIVQKSLKGEKK
jgi:hypothetical protein